MSLVKELSELLSEPKENNNYAIEFFYTIGERNSVTMQDLSDLICSGLPVDINQIFVGVCTAGNVDKVAFLLSEGADINYDYNAPLCSAIIRGSGSVVDFLLENGAEFFNARIMHEAIGAHNIKIIKLLLDNGLVIDNCEIDSIIVNMVTEVYRDNDLEKDISIIKLFIEYGANPNILTKYYLKYIFPTKTLHNSFLSIMQDNGADFNLVMCDLLLEQNN